jgi:NADH-quinone oxidoreductase subunit F
VPFECRVALGSSGLIDPRDVDEYVERCRGYSGLSRAIELGPEGALFALMETGLGASGSGRSVAGGWTICREAEGDEKYAICNAVDADGRARTARLLLGTDPHAVLEGLLIAAFTVGASRSYICVNADYREEMETLQAALRQMRDRGLLGNDILASGFSCEVFVKEITPSLIAAEGTALVRALENRQPLPYLTTDDLRVRGLGGWPTLIESAETLAKVSAILRASMGQGCSFDHAGAAVAGSAGAERALGIGTKIVTVSGDVPREATVEVPLGTTIRAVLESTQGVAVTELDLKAVQVGGPAGAFFADEGLDTSFDFEGLAEAGGDMGSGSIFVYGRGRCAVETVRDLLALLHEESCGKCVFCREGTRQLLDILDDVVKGVASEEQMALLVELGEAMRGGSICALGLQASTPVLSSLRLFGEDYGSHLENKKCPGEKA